jgi:hypothetical protein
VNGGRKQAASDSEHAGEEYWRAVMFPPLILPTT